jgi:hypothetical protein
MAITTGTTQQEFLRFFRGRLNHGWSRRRFFLSWADRLVIDRRSRQQQIGCVARQVAEMIKRQHSHLDVAVSSHVAGGTLTEGPWDGSTRTCCRSSALRERRFRRDLRCSSAFPPLARATHTDTWLEIFFLLGHRLLHFPVDVPHHFSTAGHFQTIGGRVRVDRVTEPSRAAISW